MNSKMLENKVKQGFGKGLGEGLLAIYIWDKATREAKKDTSYALGIMVASLIQPLSLIGASIDLLRGKYNLDYQVEDVRDYKIPLGL
tara:strand:- start:39808 stop:40068 length:261 start_codon:yes stop_codon:yes gene_type:complete